MIARQIESCRRCKRGGVGKAVAGEGSADAEIVFVGEAPGRHEAESGRPFVGQAGQWLHRAIQSIGLDEKAVYLTSPIKYCRARGTPTTADITHGRIHVRQQIDVIDPRIVVLLGSTACLGVLNEKIAVWAQHGRLIERLSGADVLARLLREGRQMLVFPEGTFLRPPEVLPFRLGAFKAAVDTGRPIVPIALRGTRRVLPADTHLFSRGPIDVIVGAPLVPAGQGWPEMVRLRDEARAVIARGCGEPMRPV
jgi:uracil-DNA glycosylase family 4